MGSILKILFFILLALILLVFILPLLWLVIKEAGGLFDIPSESLSIISENSGYIIFIVVCIGLIIWMANMD